MSTTKKIIIKDIDENVLYPEVETQYRSINIKLASSGDYESGRLIYTPTDSALIDKMYTYYRDYLNGLNIIFSFCPSTSNVCKVQVKKINYTSRSGTYVLYGRNGDYNIECTVQTSSNTVKAFIDKDSINSSDLSNSAVGTDNIENKAVTEDKLAADIVSKINKDVLIKIDSEWQTDEDDDSIGYTFYTPGTSINGTMAKEYMEAYNEGANIVFQLTDVYDKDNNKQVYYIPVNTVYAQEDDYCFEGSSEQFHIKFRVEYQGDDDGVQLYNNSVEVEDATIRRGATSIDDNSISTSKLQNSCVTTAKIGSKAVTGSKIADYTIALNKLNQGLNVSPAITCNSLERDVTVCEFSIEGSVMGYDQIVDEVYTDYLKGRPIYLTINDSNCRPLVYITHDSTNREIKFYFLDIEQEFIYIILVNDTDSYYSRLPFYNFSSIMNSYISVGSYKNISLIADFDNFTLTFGEKVTIEDLKYVYNNFSTGIFNASITIQSEYSSYSNCVVYQPFTFRYLASVSTGQYTLGIEFTNPNSIMSPTYRALIYWYSSATTINKVRTDLSRLT